MQLLPGAVAVLQATTITVQPKSTSWATDAQHAVTDVGVVLLAIGNMRGVGEIDQIGIRQCLCDGGQYRKSADTAVKDTGSSGAVPDSGFF